MKRRLNTIRTLVGRDILAEMRNLQIIPLSVVLALSMLVVFRLADATVSWPGMLWIVSLLVVVIVLDKALVCETRNGVLDAMLSGPVTPMEFLISKLIFTGMVLLTLQALTLIMLAVLMDQAIDRPPGAILANLLLTDLGLLLVGLICSIIALVSGHRATLLASMLWPLAVPLVLIAVVSLNATPGEGVRNWYLLLGGFDLVMLGLCPGLLRLILGR